MEITNKVIKFENSTYPLNNISSTSIKERVADVGRVELHKEYMKRIKKSILPHLILFPILIIIIIMFFGSKDYIWWNLLLVPAAIYHLGVMEDILRKKVTPIKEFAIEMSLNSGSTHLFWSDDLKFIKKINNLIIEAITQETSVNYNINIEKQEIYDNSTTTVNNYLTVDIKNQQGMSKEDFQFLIGEFKNSLESIIKEVESTDDEKLKSTMKNVVEEVNSQKPDKNKILKLYDKVKELSGGYDFAEKVYAVSGVIAAGALKFSGY
ncbi:MAG: hypothetical protein IBX55_22515 [Methyloprofundus sp.]|nr:hypothetical protein [Methyloprofundus sp.]